MLVLVLVLVMLMLCMRRRKLFDCSTSCNCNWAIPIFRLMLLSMVMMMPMRLVRMPTERSLLYSHIRRLTLTFPSENSNYTMIRKHDPLTWKAISAAGMESDEFDHSSLIASSGTTIGVVCSWIAAVHGSNIKT